MGPSDGGGTTRITSSEPLTPRGDVQEVGPRPSSEGFPGQGGSASRRGCGVHRPHQGRGADAGLALGAETARGSMRSRADLRGGLAQAAHAGGDAAVEEGAEEAVLPKHGEVDQPRVGAEALGNEAAQGCGRRRAGAAAHQDRAGAGAQGAGQAVEVAELGLMGSR